MGLRGRTSSSDQPVYFVTTTVVQFIQVFTKEKYCDILLSNIKHYQQRYEFKILGYVIMPSHFHWIVSVNHLQGTVSDVMRDIKKYSAWDVMEALENDNQNKLSRLFHFEALRFPRYNRKFWMKRFDDEVIRNDEMLRTKLNYIHLNPLKAGLVEKPEDYKYSSARNYILNDQLVLYVNTDWRL